MSYTINSPRNSPQPRGTNTVTGRGQTRGTFRVGDEEKQNQPRGTYVARKGTYTPPPRKGTYTAPLRKGTYTAPPRKGTYSAPPRKGTYTAPSRKGTYTAPPREGTYVAPPRKGTYIAPSRKGTYTAASGEGLSQTETRGTHRTSEQSTEGDINMFDSYFIDSDTEIGRLVLPGSLTAGRLVGPPSKIVHYPNESFDWDTIPGPEVQYEDDVFEPDQPARFRDAKIPSDFKKLFFFQNIQKVQEYDVLWKGLVDILETYKPFTNPQEIKCPLVLTEIVKQLIVEKKLDFRRYQIQVTIHNMTRSPNFSLIGAKISTLQRYLSDLHFWMKEELEKSMQDRTILQDQHLQMDAYLSYLEKKKQLLQDAYSSYPYDEALNVEGRKESGWNYLLRQKLMNAVIELDKTRELLCQTHEENIRTLFDQENQICKISEQFEISSLFDAAIKSVLGQSEGGVQMTEEDEELIEDWCLSLGQLYNDRSDHMVSIIEECEAFRSEVTEQETLLLVSKKNAEQLEFEVSLFSDNSVLKNESIARLRDIIRKGRDPKLVEHADLFAVRGVNMPGESFGQSLSEKAHLFSTPQRYAGGPAPLDLTFPMQPLQVSSATQQMTPIRRSESPGVAEAIIDEAFNFLDHPPSREILEQPTDLSRSQAESVYRESPEVAEGAVIDDAFHFLDQLSSGSVSQQPLQSTFIASSESARPMQHLHVSPREGDISCFAADPPRSVFFPSSERAIPRTTKQRSLIPKLDRSRMRKAAQTTRDRSLYAISEHPSTSRAVPFPRKGKKRVQPSKRPPWISSTRIPTSRIRTKTMDPMTQSLKIRSSPAIGKSRMSKTAPFKVKSRPKSLIPIRIPHTSYKLKNPRTPFRTFNAPRPQSRQMNRTFDTSLQLNMRSDDWRLKSKSFVHPKTFPIPDATVRSDRTFLPTPAIRRRGLGGRNPIIPPHINQLPGAGASTVGRAAPQMDGTFRMSDQLNRTTRVAPEINKTFRASP